jgi:hypothetical protein
LEALRLRLDFRGGIAKRKGREISKPHLNSRAVIHSEWSNVRDDGSRSDIQKLSGVEESQMVSCSIKNPSGVKGSEQENEKMTSLSRA